MLFFNFMLQPVFLPENFTFLNISLSRTDSILIGVYFSVLRSLSWQ